MLDACEVPGCVELPSTNFLFCERHWQMVPAYVRSTLKLVGLALAPRFRDFRDPNVSLMLLLHRALNAVAAEEGFKPRSEGNSNTN